MKIAVGSTNPVKVEAVRLACLNLHTDFSVEGVESVSGVSHQPMTDEETRMGAHNRAKYALEHIDEAELGVGIEGGVQESEHGLLNTVWVCLIDRNGAEFFVNGERFILPDRIAAEIRNGGEMGPVLDKIINQENTKQKQGMIGVISKNYLTRTEIYANLTKLAVGLWNGREWEKDYR